MPNTKVVEMLVDVGGFKKGQRWPLDEAPDIVKKWAELPGILGDQRICKVLDEPRTSVAEKVKEPYTCGRCGYVEGTSLDETPSAPVLEMYSDLDTKDFDTSAEKTDKVKDLLKENQEKMKAMFPDDDPKPVGPSNEETGEGDTAQRTCKGHRGDGSPCKYKGKRVLENGYCVAHQNQATS